MEVLIVCKSVHQGNTWKIGEAMAEVLDADLLEPKEVNEEKVIDIDLIGFGSGIYYGKHHESLINFVERLPKVEGKKAFIFSTSGMIELPIIHRFNENLRGNLENRGFEILDSFSCRGKDTNGILGVLGGIHKGRPNEKDLKKAKKFAQEIINHAED